MIDYRSLMLGKILIERQGQRRGDRTGHSTWEAFAYGFANCQFDSRIRDCVVLKSEPGYLENMGESKMHSKNIDNIDLRNYYHDKCT